MKILFISDNFPPEVNAPATRTYEHGKEWIKQGAEVTVLTCAPNFPQGKVYDGYKNKLYAREEIDGIQVIRVWSYIASNKGFLPRILDFVSFSAMAFIAGLFIKADVIVATSPQFFTTWAGCALSLLKRRPWVFELRDLWPESITAVGAMKKGTVIRILEKIEVFLYRNSDAVVAVSPAFKDNLMSRGIDGDKVAVIPNGANLNLYKPQPKPDYLVQALGLSGKFVISYIGTHGMAHGLNFVIEAIAELDNDIHFLFIGDGAQRDSIMAQAAELSLRNATFIKQVPKESVPDYLALSDAALVNLRSSPTFRTVIPSKIFEAAAMRIPILLGVEGQAAEIVQAHGAGVCYQPENRQSFLDAINQLKPKGNTYDYCLAGCEKLAREYDREKLAKQMLELLDNITMPLSHNT